MLRALFFLFFPSLSAALSCMNEQNQTTDMWLALKAPKGTDYLFYAPSQSLYPSPYSLNDTDDGALSYTTQQLWSADTYFIFNDDPPESDYYNYSYGHTKGYLALNDDLTGFYITHSIPQFPKGPNQSAEYVGLGGNAYTYAQNVMCISINAPTADALAYKFQLNRPQIYDSKLSSAISETFKNITNLIDGKYSSAAICATELLKTANGNVFTIFAKSKEWNDDLYNGCVAPEFKSDLWVETWIRGSEEGPSCPTSGYDTLDVEALDFTSDFSWSETQDHSKWAIVLEQDAVCMGDINRMTTQYSRGGGTACIYDYNIFSEIQAAVTKKDSCYLR